MVAFAPKVIISCLRQVVAFAPKVIKCAAYGVAIMTGGEAGEGWTRERARGECGFMKLMRGEISDVFDFAGKFFFFCTFMM